jgi:hypothetical protein
VIDYFGGYNRSIPAIITTFALPLMVYFSSLFYEKLFNEKKIRLRIVGKLVASVCLMFMISMSFFAPWSHRYVAIFLYDPSISPTDVSMHEPASLQLTPFVREHLQLNKDDYVLSDNRLLALMILQPSNYQSIRFHGSTPHLIGAKNTYIFELMDFNPPFDLPHYTWSRDTVSSAYNQVYDNEHSKIHYIGD